MRKAFKIVAVVVAVALATVPVLASTKPDSFQVQRSTTIQAPPDKVFALINDFKRWEAWSPWEKKDPAMQRTYGYAGQTSGKGAFYAWDGNSEVGQGSMTIAESVPPSRVALKLDFVKPFEGHNTVDFTLEPKSNGTLVTWTMQGPSPFITKVIQVFCDMDAMIGKDFEAGLAGLKALAEK
ncbi:MAG: SRPBCC family protein [Burkholderiales bacterium]